MMIAEPSTWGWRARSRPVPPAAASNATARATARASARAGRVHRYVGVGTDGARRRDVEAWAWAVAAAATGAAAAAASAATSRRIDRYRGQWWERKRAPNGGWCGVKGGKGHSRDIFLGGFRELAADHLRTGRRRAGDGEVARGVGFGGHGGRDVCHAAGGQLTVCCWLGLGGRRERGAWAQLA